MRLYIYTVNLWSRSDGRCLLSLLKADGLEKFGMGAESSVVLGAEATNFFFDGWDLYVTPNSRW
jgi:hypothetical protein